MSILLKNKNMKTKLKIQSIRSVAYIAALLVLVGSFSAYRVVRADTFDEQINALKAKNSQNQSQASALQAQANSIQDVVNGLQQQIDTLQKQINDDNAKIADLNVQIAQAEAELAKERDLLGQNIKAMYLEGDISTLEMLASSKDISDFVDKQEYRSTVKDKIKDTLDKITALKLQLNSQKEEVESILKDQQNMQATVSAQQAQQNALLSFTQAQKDQYLSAIKYNNSQISSLRAQQAAANASHFRGYTLVAGNNGDDSYPNNLRNAGQDTLVDPWGMYNRECVSYTAWKVYERTGYMPYWGGYGNANQWPANARNSGIPVDGSPRAGDVAIAYWGSFGHAMYVDSVNSDGTINISQYNWDYHGTFSQIYNFSTSGLVFIHF